jgi:hypothetical protein
MLHGGVFSGTTLTNRNMVRQTMVAKFEGFGRLYLTNFIAQHSLPAMTILKALLPLPQAAADVADLFINKLLACRF